MKLSPILSFVLGATFASIATTAASAEAAWTRVHASGCYNANTWATLADMSYGIGNDFPSWIPNFPPPIESLMCSVPDTPAIPKWTLTVANVEGWAPSQPFQAQACNVGPDGETGKCSPMINSGGVSGQHQTAILGSYAPQIWGSIGLFGYVWIAVPQGSRIAGIFYSQS